MSALHKIIDEILRQAQIKADEILNEAEKTCDAIREQARFEREVWKQQFDQMVNREMSQLTTQVESAIRQERRRKLLEVRNLVIDEVMDEARAAIHALSDEAYADFLLSLFKKNALPLDGSIRFAPADYVRLPADFVERCKRFFPDNILTMTGDMENIKHGFVIQYGSILQNCSIDSIFAAEEQALRDRAYRVLSSDL